MKNTWNPDIGAQIGPAWAAVRTNLTTRTWGSENLAITVAMKAGDIQHKTAKNLIRDLVKHGYIERRKATTGKHNQIRLVTP